MADILGILIESIEQLEVNGVQVSLSWDMYKMSITMRKRSQQQAAQLGGYPWLFIVHVLQFLECVCAWLKHCVTLRSKVEK